MPILNGMFPRWLLSTRVPAAFAALMGTGRDHSDAPGQLPRQAKGNLMAFLTVASGFVMLGDVLPADSGHVHRDLALWLGALIISIGVVFWLIPWRRLPPYASLATLPLAFVLLAVSNYADPNPYTYGIPFLVVYLWLGAAHRRWTSVATLPVAAIAFAAPLVNTPDAADSWIGSTVCTLGLCAVLGESLAWAMQNISATQLQLAARRSQARFQALTSNAAEIVAILDESGTVSYCSPAVEGVLDVQPESLIGVRLWDRVHPEDAPVVERLVAETIADRASSHRAEFRLRHRDGAWRHIEAICRDMRQEPEVHGLVLNAGDVTERKSLERELAHRAFHDALTELPNREMLVDRLGQALARSARGGQRTALLFVDLDSFKIINDTLGHLAGDDLLVSVAQRLRASVRAGDTAGRMAGDEFILLLEDLSSVDEARIVAERFQTQLRTPIALGEQSVVVGASIGIAYSDGRDGILPDDLLRRAEVAMYAAKNRGKSQIAWYDASMTRTSLDRLELEADMRRALDNGEFRVWYQPIVDLETGQVNGVEALVRWQHPTRGLIAPDKFISVAEDTGLIVPIGRSVLREACCQAHVWQETLPLTVSVNLSARQFQHPGLLEDVASALAESGLPPELLKLEVTESVAMDSGVGTIQTFQALRGLGVRLAIDDFGTGYSSLAYLKRFPVDTLKIDRSFVDGVASDEQDAAIVRSVVALARTLGLRVTAEGIETPSQLEALRALSCDEGQGYFFQRPQPSEVMGDALLKSGDDLARAA
jgi:diguanylate cyclase (GGDEF)-like protein/PAS domain S-box-containing protein